MIPFIFVAEYEDGQTYHQTPMDVSQQNPMKSAFYDIRVSPLIPEERLVRFGLVRLRRNPVLVVAVDLRTGGLTINGQSVPVPGNAPRKREGVPLRLLYEKRNELDLKTRAQKVTCRLGWTCENEWLALDLQAHPEDIKLNGTHNAKHRPELEPALIG